MSQDGERASRPAAAGGAAGTGGEGVGPGPAWSGGGAREAAAGGGKGDSAAGAGGVTATEGDADLLALRAEFPILATSTYLLSHSMGAMPRGVRESLLEYADDWARDGQEAWEKWFPRVLEWGNVIGGMMNAEPDSVVFHQNVTSLMAVAASTLRADGRRNRVVYTTQNFPTNHYFWSSQAGIECVRVASPDGVTIPTERVVEAIDDRTLAVIVDHGIYVSGWLQDVPAIVRAAAKHGAATIVDAYQTIGVVPFDVRAWGADFVIGGAHKWLCGGPGAGFLYARPDRLKAAEPRITGWISQAKPFEFVDRVSYADSAFRFAGGTPGIASLYAAMPGIRWVAKVGPARVREKNLRQMQRVIARADERGIAVKSPRDGRVRSGLVILDFPGADRASRELIARRVFVDHRPGAGIRVSAHYYTTDWEIDAFFKALDDVRGR